MKLYHFTKYHINSVIDRPGIYILKNKHHNILYIGKSKSLKKRLLSYLGNNLLGKTQSLISNVVYFSLIYVGTDLEAILLESKLIRRYQPKYNIISKDDKSPLYISISSDEYPLVKIKRRSDINQTDSFFVGPFLSKSIIISVLKRIRRTFPYCSNKIGKKPCFYSQIGLCNPCPSQITKITDLHLYKMKKEEYLRNIRKIKKILSGNISKIKTETEGKILKYSKTQNFENALKLKKTLDNIKYLSLPFNNIVKYEENPNLYEDVLFNDYLHFLYDLKKTGIYIKKHGFIVAYDISHFSGKATAASEIVFYDGLPQKSKYKRYKINFSDNNDLASLKEVASRRKKRSDFIQPDLIIIDGGDEQVSSFLEEFKSQSVPVIGIAKKHETISIPFYLNGYLKYKHFNPNGGSLKFVQSVRDEAHRFANNYQKLLFKREVFKAKKHSD